jgi:SSS family solute:Na+ symporter
LSLWVAFTHQESLFNLMVTVLGLFMAPTLLPLLAGLTIRRLNWQGAFAGFLCGLIAGCVMLAVKLHWARSSTAFGSTYNFEGVSLLVNMAATIIGMITGTLLWPSTQVEVVQVARFFRLLDTPIQPSEIPRSASNPAAPVLGMSTATVGLLILFAGIISGSRAALTIDSSVGIVLITLGALFHRSAK